MAKSVIPLSKLPIISAHSAVSESGVFITGAVVLIDKPLRWSSFDAVHFVRNRIPVKKVGHAGTLDPLATGLLVLCTGKATRTISQIQSLKKIYETTITFGGSTPSYDAATEVDEEAGWEHITREQVQQKLDTEFSGTIVQSPPMYSAIRVEGERLYKKARRGEKIKTPPRQVTIHNCEILGFDPPDLRLRVVCGKGTYIRSIGHDLGLSLNSRAHLTSLRRTAIGTFSVDDALSPDTFDIYIKEA